jgi:intein/homing endonuclease
MASETEKAYLAGLIDGEGTIHIVLQRNKTKKIPEYFFSEVYITNTKMEMLRWVQERFGGKIRFSRKNENRNWKPVYRIHYHGKDAMALLAEAGPYLVIKKEHALLLFAMQARLSRYQHPLSDQEREARRVLYWKCRELNHRGLKGIERLSERAPAE